VYHFENRKGGRRRLDPWASGILVNIKGEHRKGSIPSNRKSWRSEKKKIKEGRITKPGIKSI
jgi:hypothetical protein